MSDSESTDSEIIEKKKRTPKEKVDKRKTGGLENRSPAQIAAYEKMRAKALERLEQKRKEKVEKGLEIIAKKELAKKKKPEVIEDSESEPEAPKHKVKSKKKATKIVIDNDSSSSEDEATRIVVKTKKKKSKVKKHLTPVESEDEDDYVDQQESPKSVVPHRETFESGYVLRYV